MGDAAGQQLDNAGTRDLLYHGRHAQMPACGPIAGQRG